MTIYCKNCRFWSDKLAQALGGRGISAYCLVEGGPFAKRYTQENWHCPYGINGPLGAIDSGSDLDPIYGNPYDPTQTAPKFKSRRKPYGLLQKNNTSGVPGVYYIKETKKWKASITINRHQIYLGVFNTKGEAKLCRQKAETELLIPPKFNETKET